MVEEKRCDDDGDGGVMAGVVIELPDEHEMALRRQRRTKRPMLCDPRLLVHIPPRPELPPPLGVSARQGRTKRRRGDECKHLHFDLLADGSTENVPGCVAVSGDGVPISVPVESAQGSERRMEAQRGRRRARVRARARGVGRTWRPTRIRRSPVRFSNAPLYPVAPPLASRAPDPALSPIARHIDSPSPPPSLCAPPSPPVSTTKTVAAARRKTRKQRADSTDAPAAKRLATATTAATVSPEAMRGTHAEAQKHAAAAKGPNWTADAPSGTSDTPTQPQLLPQDARSTGSGRGAQAGCRTRVPPRMGDRVDIWWEDRQTAFAGKLSKGSAVARWAYDVMYDDGDYLVENLDDLYWRYDHPLAGGDSWFEPGDISRTVAERDDPTFVASRSRTPRRNKSRDKLI